jgi:hypothetical protein
MKPRLAARRTVSAGTFRNTALRASTLAASKISFRAALLLEEDGMWELLVGRESGRKVICEPSAARTAREGIDQAR